MNDYQDPADAVDATHKFSEDLIPVDANSLSDEDQQAVDSLPTGNALLIVRRGPNKGSRFLLDADLISIGRHPNADIFLDDVTVSRKHAEFVRNGKTFSVKDLASLNGTYHNGKRVDEIALTDGDEVQVGKFKLTFFAAKADK